uniref:Ribosomal protein S14 n=1 Tax=Synura synuroidea TaxID=47573 RepID=Q9MG91_9STRA|nr:ribosomal protein S14 [Synura synuroidea]AAF36958.1 ribosomal protein S14 [Synura synuroidea]
MLSLRSKEYKKRKKFKKAEKFFLITKFLFRFITCSPTYKIKNQILINKYLALKKKYSKVRLVNRCVLTNRSRGVFRPFGLSRFILRKVMMFGLIPGFKKAVW